MKSQNEEKADFLKQLGSWFQQAEKESKNLYHIYEYLFETELRNEFDYSEESDLRDELIEFTDCFCKISKCIYDCRQNLT